MHCKPMGHAPRLPGVVLLHHGRRRRVALQGSVLGCGLLLLPCPFGAAISKVGNSDRAAMDSAPIARAGRKTNATPRIRQIRANRLAEGKLPICAEMCSTKSLLAGDGAIIAEIYKERVMKRGYGSGMWGWKTAYSDSPTG